MSHIQSEEKYNSIDEKYAYDEKYADDEKYIDDEKYADDEKYESDDEKYESEKKLKISNTHGYNYDTGSWHCIECGIDMGPTNPRQLCGKSRCYIFG